MQRADTNVAQIHRNTQDQEGWEGKDKLQEAEVFLSPALVFQEKKPMPHETRSSSPMT